LAFRTVFHDFDRHDEHVHFLKWLTGYITDNKIDVLLIAGDVYDGPNPSAEAQKLFYSFIHNVVMRNEELKIIITAGNHDSASRLEAPNPLLEVMNVTVRGVVRKTADGEIDLGQLIVPVYIKNVLSAYCLAVPYLRQGDYPRSDSYSEGVQKLYHLLYEKVKTSHCR
jgi:exonuclease SbcD